ncbi:hypothetical protein [Sulfuritalea hydrogenivorans]|nr:hypothetical protein [Sulfuritalea hydrogenivorans]
MKQIDEKGTDMQGKRELKSRRWRDGDSIMDSTNQYLWRVAA